MEKSEFSEMNVLVLEENQDNADLVKSILFHIGIKKIITSINGDDGFKKLGDFYPDLVLCNLVLPPDGGLDFVRRLRSADGGPNKTVPVIMMSQHTATKNIIEASKAGANNFVAKPLSGKALRSSIIAVLKKANQPRAGSAMAGASA